VPTVDYRQIVSMSKKSSYDFEIHIHVINERDLCQKVVINTKAPAAVDHIQAIRRRTYLFREISINPSTGEMVKGNIKEQTERR
jgi:hypothetical protein